MKNLEQLEQQDLINTLRQLTERMDELETNHTKVMMDMWSLENKLNELIDITE